LPSSIGELAAVVAAVAGVEKLVLTKLDTVCREFRANRGGGSVENCWLGRVVGIFKSSLLVFMVNGVTFKYILYDRES
jgi:hypothetical protein